MNSEKPPRMSRTAVVISFPCSKAITTSACRAIWRGV
jgi:hypothetical protein